MALVLSASCFGSAALLGGCAGAEPEEDETARSEDSLTSAGLDLKGALQLGDDATLAYRTSSKYAAYSFVAKKGDLVDLRVHSMMMGKSTLYLLDASFATVASNNNTLPSELRMAALDPHLQATIPANGTYYLAFRYPDSATVTVSTKLLPNATPTPTSNDGFDAASCPGLSMNFKDAATYIKSQGIASKEAPYTLMVRHRACNGASCDPWGAPEPFFPVAVYGPTPVNYWPVAGYVRLTVDPGMVDGQMNSKADRIRVYTADAPPGGVSAENVRGLAFVSREPRALLQSTPLSFTDVQPTYEYSYMTSNFGTYRSFLQPKFNEISITKSCVRIVSEASSTDREQFALLARF